MAYNFLCRTELSASWVKINRLMSKYDRLEAFPLSLPDSDIPALAISIPAKNVSVRAYRELVSAYKKLSRKYGFTFYDMYYDKVVDKAHLKALVKELT